MKIQNFFNTLKKILEKGKHMLITIITVLIVLSYFIFKAARFGKLKVGEAAITAILCIGITAYFILFIITGI